MKYSKLVLLLVFFFLRVPYIFPQYNIDWIERYDGGFGDDGGLSIVTDDSGNVYCTGSSYGTQTRQDMVLLKYSSMGLTKWVSRERDTLNNNFMAGFDVKVDKFYNVYVAGTGLFKYDTDGNLLWKSLTDGRYSYLAIDDSSNSYVGGTSNGGGRFVTKKFSPAGILLWERTYQNLDYNSVRGLVLDKSGNVLITGQSSQTGSLYDFVTIKYSNNGDQIWLRRYNGGNDDIPYGLTTDDSNNVYVTGWNKNTTVDALTIKYSPDGDTIWKAVFDGGSGDVGYDIEVDSLGCVYVSGIAFGNDYLTLKYNISGNLLWSRIQPGNQIAYQHPVIKLDRDRNVYMSYVTMRTGNFPNYAVVKYNTEGIQKFIAEYNNGGSSVNYIYDLVLDNETNLCVTGESDGGHGYSIATVKFIQNPTTINPIPNIIPEEFHLEQNYPNPFNPVTHLGFGISNLPAPGNNNSENYNSGGGFVSLKVYDALGKEVAALVNEKKNPGSYEVEFNGSDLPSGIYFYSMQIDGEIVQTKKMSLIK